MNLTAPLKKQITEDWQRRFPSLGIYKPMWLLKRHGPLVMGIVLDKTRSNDVYIPAFHVYNLLYPFPAISLSLAYRVPVMGEPRIAQQIPVSKHTQEFEKAACFFKNTLPDLDQPVLLLSRALELHADFIRQKRDYAVARFCRNLFGDVILLLAWSGREAHARQTLEDAARTMTSWNPAVDVVEWKKSLVALMSRETMEKTLASEIERHGLSRIPVGDFKSDEAVPPLIAEVYEEVWKS